MRKILLLGFLIGIITLPTYSQELNFSQFFNLKQYYNPVDAASFEGTDAYLIYRNQWQGLTDPFSSAQFSASHAILRDGDPDQHLAGIGFDVHNFNAGANNYGVFGASLNVAYNLNLSESRVSKLTFGLKAAYEQRSVGISSLTWGNQYNPNIGYDENINANESDFVESIGLITVGAGIGYYFNERVDPEVSNYSFHIKAAGLNLNQPEVNLSGVKSTSEMMITSELGLHYLAHEHYLIGFDVLYLQMGDNQLLNPGLNLSYIINKDNDHHMAIRWLKVGASYRLDNAYVGLIGIGNGVYRVHFSYDITSNSISDVASGFNAYEISLGFRFIKKKHIQANPYNNRHDPRI